MTIRRSGFGGAAVFSVGVTLACVISACSAAPGERAEAVGEAYVYPTPHQQLAPCTTPPTTGCEGYSANLGWFAITYDGKCPDVGRSALGYYKGFTSTEFLNDASAALVCAQSAGYALDEWWWPWFNAYSDDMNWSQPFCAYRWVPSPIGVQSHIESGVLGASTQSLCQIASVVEVACSPVPIDSGLRHGSPPKCMGSCAGWGM